MTTSYTVHWRGESYTVPDCYMAEAYSRAGAVVTAVTQA